MTNEEAVYLAKDQFIKASEAALKTALLASPLSFLETPPLNILTNKVIHWATTALAKDIELAVFFAYINFNVNQQGHDYIQAVYKNKQAQLNGSEDEKKIAIKNLEDSFSKLITLSR